MSKFAVGGIFPWRRVNRLRRMLFWYERETSWVYPKQFVGVYEKRTERMEGANKFGMEIVEAVSKKEEEVLKDGDYDYRKEEQGVFGDMDYE